MRCGIGSVRRPWDRTVESIARSRNSSERIQLLYNASMTVSDTTVGPCRPRCRPCLDSLLPAAWVPHHPLSELPLADVTPRDYSPARSHNCGNPTSHL